MARIAIVGVALIGLLVLVPELGGDRLTAQSREALVAEGRRLFNEKGCYGCHTVGAAGTPIGPDLRRTAARYPEADLARWLRDPAAQEPTRHMPNLQLSEADASAIAAFVASLR